uniref:Uncharacterized protein n=1 Tax=Anguilla anguilla TaxID=7936 RepID=A0A0E9PHC0_ANGAN
MAFVFSGCRCSGGNCSGLLLARP